MGDDGQRIRGLTAALIVAARAAADAAEIEADARYAPLHESQRQRKDNLVVERSAVERVRMTDHAEPRWRDTLAGAIAGRHLHQRLDLAGGAGDSEALRPRRLHDGECAVAS